MAVPRRRERSALELALLLPLMLLVLVGAVEWGNVLAQQLHLALAVREGARLGATVAPRAKVPPDQAALSRTTSALQAAHVDPRSVNLTAWLGGAPPNRALTVTAQAPYQPMIGVVPTPKNLGYSMTMVLEAQF